MYNTSDLINMGHTSALDLVRGEANVLFFEFSFYSLNMSDALENFHLATLLMCAA